MREPPGSAGEERLASDPARFGRYLTRPTAPLALAEVASPEQAEEVIAELARTLGERCQVFRAQAGGDPRAPLDWLDERRADEATFVIAGLHAWTHTQAGAREFWTWANGQRERWDPAAGKLLFLLEPRDVDAMVRFADDLWEWIPLKFDLIARRGPERASGVEALLTLAEMRPLAEGDQALIATQREQLRRGKAAGLPPRQIRRDYAFPLLETLAQAGSWSEAAGLLSVELPDEVEGELSPSVRPRWDLAVGRVLAAQGRWPAAEQRLVRACQAFRELGDRVRLLTALLSRATVAAGDEAFGRAEELWDEAQRLAGEEANPALAQRVALGRGALDELRGRETAAEQRYRTALEAEAGEEAADPGLIAAAQGLLGGLLARGGDRRQARRLVGDPRPAVAAEATGEGGGAEVLFAWIQLADLQFGRPARGAGADLPLLRQALQGELVEHARRVVPRVDALLVAGNVGFRGEQAEYTRADAWLQARAAALGCGPAGVFLVPGSHDVPPCAKADDRDLWRLLRDLREGESLDEALDHERDRARLVGRLQAFDGFAASFAAVERPHPLAWRAALEGGRRLRLRLLGLNTAILAQGQDQGRLQLGLGALHAGLGDGAAEPDDLTLLLSHHPFEGAWLRDQEQVRAWARSRVGLHLCAHVRAGGVRQLVTGGGGTLLSLDAGVRPGADGPLDFGYYLAAILCSAQRELFLRVWPRRWLPELQGFRADVSNTAPDRFFAELPLGLRLPERAPRPVARAKGLDLHPVPPEAWTDARLVVVAVGAELGDAQRAVAERLGRLAGVGEARLLDPDAAEAAAAVDGADVVVVLVGARPGEGKLLAELVPRPAAIVLRRANADYLALEPGEARRAIELGQAVQERPAFADPAQAAELAAEAIAEWLRERAPQRAGELAVLERWERSYLSVRLPQWRQGRVGPLRARAQGRALERARLYVSLRATPELCYQREDGSLVVQDPNEAPQGAAALRALGGEREQRRAVTLERALSQPELPYLVVVGEPGAGKTVLLQHVAFVLAGLHLGEAPAEHTLDLEALTGARSLRPVPVLLEASRLAAALGEEEGIGGVVTAILREMQDGSGEAPAREALRVGLAAGRYLLLVDSLDEVPRSEARARVVQCLEGYGRAACRSRVVLTTRPMAYLGSLSFAEPLRLLQVAPLGAREVAALSERWCREHSCPDGYQPAMQAALREVERRHQAELTANPLLLTCTLLVYAQQQRLPDSTAELYHQIVEVLCRTRSGAEGPDGRRQRLQKVFLALQQAGGTSLPVEQAADGLLAAQPRSFATRDQATQALDDLASATGLLRFGETQDAAGRPVAVVRPWHRSFQEYLAACELAAAVGAVPEETAALCGADPARPAVAFDPAWEGVLRFLVGAHGQRGTQRAWAHVLELFRQARLDPGEAAPRRGGRLLGLVASGLSDYRELFEEHPLWKEVPPVLVEAFERDGAEWALRDRLLALEALGRIGDPRLKRDLWVEVEGGPVRLGDPGLGLLAQELYEGSQEEAPSVTLESWRSWIGCIERDDRVASHSIAWRPVVVADFANFVADSQGYRAPKWWKAGRAESDGEAPAHWEDQLHQPNRPVIGVSWYAAQAYCAWANETRRGELGLAPAQRLRLPREAEWEHAARGRERMAYPWGGEIAGEGDVARMNYGFVGAPRHPTPVGAFPAGHRGRLADLAGNVWEWCLDKHPDSGVFKVFRGGGWGFPAWYCRGAFRGGSPPASRHTNLGFRLVRVQDSED